MRKIVVSMLAIIMLALINPVLAQKKENKVVCFKSDMDCANCEKTVGEYLKFEKGVKDLKVDHASNTIRVEYKDGKNTDEKLAKAIEKKGYKAEKITPEQYKVIVEKTKAEGHHHEVEVHRERKD